MPQQQRWILTKFFTASDGSMQPTCAAYGTRWHCPVRPADTSKWALVQMALSIQGIAAAAQDSSVHVLPDLSDASALPTVLVNAFSPPAAGATANAAPMFQVLTSGANVTIAQLINKLIAVEPCFGHLLDP